MYRTETEEHLLPNNGKKRTCWIEIIRTFDLEDKHIYTLARYHYDNDDGWYNYEYIRDII